MTLLSLIKEIRNIDLDKKTSHGIQVVIAGFICNFMVFGIAFTYGVFQEFYTSKNGPLRNYSDSKVALIGTVGTSLTYMFGIFNKSLAHYFKPSQIMICGSILMSLGLILTGFCNKYYQFILTQGIMFGLGSSFIYLPPVVCAPAYFDKHRGIAMGIVFSGTGFGGLAMASFSRYLIDTIGWQWCVRVLGFINLFVTLIASFLVKEPEDLKNANSRSLINFGQLGSLKVWLQLGASLLQSAGYLVPLFYMSKYAQTLGFLESQGALFIGVNNAVNAVFKILIGHLADRVGRLNMIAICSSLSAITVFTLWMVNSRDAFISFVILYGVVSGAIISLLPTCLVEIFGIQNYHTLSGLMYFMRGVGSMLGSPIAGLFISHGGLHAVDYRGLVIYNGSVLMGSTILLICLRFAVSKNWKV